ncbi:FAD-dependent oxidoreductase [Thermodesulforhabdus norvegica]|uniref:NADPH-dependent 2,4-dienoyl-CoA reductase, sulfur reductase n=1 Tax=Thermodesulforhabdus norvegica TaxID=39841 RepID=A0A1I4VQU5_9BACT|nr:FAD-dependent oxidoreductase [Thermodesulforhabdus norvegica]SFN03661.1 NADPH-dependent 2,4-dienoyl-CoA reductase, sulfur reductase [Thermodesulforhabdus norvegica]
MKKRQVSRRVVIIGAVAVGPKVACRVKRLDPNAHVLMIDQDEFISYGGCGIPFFVSGDVSDVKELMSTSFHMLRDPKFFRNVKGVEVRTRTRATEILRETKEVVVEDLNTGKVEKIPYDYLVLATGATPRRLPIPGSDHPDVFTVSNLHDAVAIREKLSRGEVGTAVVIGGGPIGCEMAEALADMWGVEVSVVEILPTLLPAFLEPPLARIVQKHMEEKGVSVYTGETVEEIREENGTFRVKTGRRTLSADIVIQAVGVNPRGELAVKAGLMTTPKGAIAVNERLQTSDPFIYAGGDCIEVPHLVTGRYVHIPMGSLANRQGRVIGTNIAGGYATFEGVVGSFCLKVFDLGLATTGITYEQALKEGFDPVRAYVVQSDRAHFYPTQGLMYMALIADRKTRRILGAQGIGKNGDAVVGRINSIAALLQLGGTLNHLSNLEIAYAPPFASAMDIVNAAANTAENIIEGLNDTIDPDEFIEVFLGEDSGDRVRVLDVRSPVNARPFVERFGERWINIPQEELLDRLAEVPEVENLMVFCNSGLRSYEALRQISHHLGRKARNVQGGAALIKMAGLLPENGDD